MLALGRHMFVVIYMQSLRPKMRWLRGVTVMKLDLRSKGREFDSRSGRYQVVTTWMGVNSLRTGKPSRYITTIKVNSAFYPSRVGKSSSDLYGWS